MGNEQQSELISSSPPSPTQLPFQNWAGEGHLEEDMARLSLTSGLSFPSAFWEGFAPVLKVKFPLLPCNLGLTGT